MQLSADTIFEAALGLPETERLVLVTRLLDSMPPDNLTLSMDDPDLLQELDRRFADTERSVSWSELEAEG